MPSCAVTSLSVCTLQRHCLDPGRRLSAHAQLRLDIVNLFSFYESVLQTLLQVHSYWSFFWILRLQSMSIYIFSVVVLRVFSLLTYQSAALGMPHPRSPHFINNNLVTSQPLH